MQFLRANTQVIVTVGPFVDVSDQFTPQTDIDVSSSDEAELLKHGSTSVVDISGATWVAVTNCRGYYSLTLTTSHTDTEGLLVVIVQDDSECLPVKQEFMVLSKAAWDSLYVAKNSGFMEVDSVKLDRNADLIESGRGFHTWQGNYFYVDPVNGNDSTGDGTRALPYASIQAAHDDLVTDSNHDVIFLVAGASGGVTTHTVAATTTISKRYTFIRGPGRDFVITRSGNGDTLAVTADGIEISGVQIGTAGTGSGNGVDLTGADFLRVHHCWFLDTQGDGINILRGSNCQLHNNHFEGTGVGGSGQGIHISGTAGSSNDNVLYDNHFADTGGDSILIEQGTTNDTTIRQNEIHNAGGWGINIGGSSNDTIVIENTLGNNTSGDINDGGTTSVIKNNYDIWDEAQAGHVTAGSFGEIATEIAAILVDTDTTIPALIAALNDLSASDVLTQVNTALDTAISELGVAAPTATPSIRTGLMLLYMALRNKLVTQTSGTDALEIHNNEGTKIASKSLSDDGADYTEAKMA